MLKSFKFDKGWKLLIYFDIIVPALLYAIALITNIPALAKLFHSYEMFIVNPIPNLITFTGLIGIVYHIGIMVYTIVKRNYWDMALCILLSLLITTFFYFEINYLILQPLSFASF